MVSILILNPNSVSNIKLGDGKHDYKTMKSTVDSIHTGNCMHAAKI